MVFKLRGNQIVLTLMNKNRPVVRYAYDFGTHSAVKVLETPNPEYAPPIVLDGYGRITRATIDRWWRSRSIPASRQHFKRLMSALDLSSALELAERSYGLSLSDRYWVCPDGDRKTWDELNFFDNDFTDDLGVITLGRTSSGAPDLFSPNSTLGGNLLKKWTISEGKRTLVKAGSGLFNQEPFNELAATALYRRVLDTGDYVPYSLLEQDRRTYSSCPNLLEDDEELITAHDLIVNNHLSMNPQREADELAGLFESLGVPDARLAIDKMLTTDLLIANDDRHFRNFGIIRDVETLEYKRFAPLFDSGHSLWCYQELLEVPADYSYVTKPFGYNGTPSDKVLDLVSDLSWLDLDRLKDYPDEMAEILAKNQNIPDRRIERVREGVASAIARVAARRASRAPSPAQFAVVPSEAELSEAVAAREGGGIARSSTVRREDPGRE